MTFRADGSPSAEPPVPARAGAGRLLGVVSVLFAGLGVAALPATCCGAPLLFSGLLGGTVIAGVGGTLANPWLIGTGSLLAGAAVVDGVRQRAIERPRACPTGRADHVKASEPRPSRQGNGP